MKVALFEDEPPALAHLERALRRALPTVDVVARHETVAGARAWLAGAPAVDLVFSDIQLADGLAISLFVDVDVPVVFATAHDEHLLDAFRCATVDYLLKPIDDEDVARALTRPARLRGALQRDSLTALKAAVDAPRRRLLSRHGGLLRAVAVDDIAYIVAEDKLTFAVTHAGDEHVIDKSLAALGRELDPATFFRANRGVIVSVVAVRGCRSLGKGRLAVSVTPRPRHEIVVPQEHGAAFRAWLDR